MIKDAINLLVSGGDINSIDFREVFDEIFSGLSEVSQSASFLTILKTKELSNNLYFSAITSARDAIKRYSFLSNDINSFESVDFFINEEIFNPTFAIDVICCASGLKVVKSSFDYPLFQNSSFEILKQFGAKPVFVEDDFIDSFEKTNFIYSYLSTSEPFFKYSKDLAVNLPFDNMLFKISKMLNPFCSLNQFIGVSKKEEVELWANIALKLNNLNTIVVSGDDFPFVSLWNQSFVAEAWKNKIFTYVLTPDLLGFESCDKNELICSSKDEYASNLTDIFKNKVKNAKYDLITLNSGLALYISKKADSLFAGINLAKKIIDDGLALEKLEQIIKIYS